MPSQRTWWATHFHQNHWSGSTSMLFHGVLQHNQESTLKTSPSSIYHHRRDTLISIGSNPEQLKYVNATDTGYSININPINPLNHGENPNPLTNRYYPLCSCPILTTTAKPEHRDTEQKPWILQREFKLEEEKIPKLRWKIEPDSSSCKRARNSIEYRSGPP